MPAKTAQEVAADNARDKARRDAEDANLSPEEKEARFHAAMKARDAIDAESVPQSEVHTYPDGSQRVGVPPFADKSPLEEAADKLERVGAPASPQPVAPVVIPPGMATSGEK